MLASVVRRRSVRLLLAMACLAAAMAWPLLAWACPACAGTETQNATFLKVGSLFVLVPFMVVGVVLRVLRRAP